MELYLKRRKRPSLKESYLQQSFLQWLRFEFPNLYELSASFPNSGKRSYKTASRMKAEGMKKGMPDLAVFYPTEKHHGLFIEFKSEKGRLTVEQKHMIELLTEQGYCCAVCNDLEQGVQLVRRYLND